MKEFSNGVWTPSEPESGDEVIIYDSLGGSIQRIWLETQKRNKVVITSHSGRQVVPVGGDITVSAEIRDSEGSVLPFSDSFAVPVGRLGGGIERTLLMEFVNGEAEKTIHWPNSGEFNITEDMINTHLEESQKFDFETFYISVGE